MRTSHSAALVHGVQAKATKAKKLSLVGGSRTDKYAKRLCGVDVSQTSIVDAAGCFPRATG